MDYRKGDEAVVFGIQEALDKIGVKEVKYAFDGISEKNSYQNISRVLAKEGSKISLILPGRDHSQIPKEIEQSTMMVASVHRTPAEDGYPAGTVVGGKEFGYLFFRFFSRGLREGWFTAHPYEVVPGGLDGIESGLSNLKNGANSATKYVFKIGETK